MYARRYADRVTTTLEQGLTSAEVAERVARGLVNDVPQGPSRSTADIVRANVVTRFNILLGALLVVVMVVAPVQDALFGVVLVVNTAIGIIQELRAKQTLDRLALLSAPKARVVRDGAPAEIPVGQVVLDDVVELEPGDQVVVDGAVTAAQGLEVDESLLTGESDPVAKEPGDEVLSGSFCAAGSGRYRASRVGREAYAARLAEEARKFTLVQSELRSGIDLVLAGISWLLVPTVALLVWSQVRSVMSLGEAMRVSAAGVVGMVPQGLVLLTSVAFAVAVIRLGRRQVLVQELPSVEGLARVDVVCFDKTGTLTRGSLSVQAIEVLDDAVDAHAALAAISAADPTPNATLRAIGAHNGESPGWQLTGMVPFSSARKWSGASFAETGSWVLGAPEVVLPGDHRIAEQVERHALDGKRVLLLARSGSLPDGDVLPVALAPVALVVLGDDLRPDAADTLRYFAEQGVAAKVISGDHPQTVGAIARRIGIPGAEQVVDARDLPDDQRALAASLDAATVFGRVTPHQKRAMVKALQGAGHVVAMTGDGVNDVLALKDADIGIAMGSGSSASRAVAQLVLLEGQFDTLPDVVGEGRRVIANIERVANLFVTKTVYAVFLAVAVGVLTLPFPFVPRHLTLVGTLTIGLPAFFLALAPSKKRARRGFIKRVLRFAVPVGILAGASTSLAYWLAISEDLPVIEARTVATMVLGAIGLAVLAVAIRPLQGWHQALLATMAFSFFVVLATPGLRQFFELELPPAVFVFAAVGIVALAVLVMYGGLTASGWIASMPDWRSDAPVELSEQWSWGPLRILHADPDQPSEGSESSNTLRSSS